MLERKAMGFVTLLALGIVVVELWTAGALPVKRGRHEVDRRVAQIARTHQAPKTVLLSDSVSYEALAGAQAPAGTLDLSSNQTIGVAGNYFMLRRLLDRLGADAKGIERVVYAVSPKALDENLQSKLFLPTYFTSVFTRPEEIEGMQQALGRTDLVEAMSQARKRALVELPLSQRQGVIRDPLGSLLREVKRKLKRNSASPVVPNPDAQKVIGQRSANDAFAPSPASEVYLKLLAELCAQREIELILVSPPIAPSIQSARESNGYEDQFSLYRTKHLSAQSGLRWIHPCPYVPPGDGAFYDGVHLEQGAKDAWGQTLAKLL
jgi:hypothetical protein